ncbi:MAG: hypothetical protein HY904_06425 [Deltaproteobacteria bacterium]|nr:hypothetical protein [Deltaproteobacteria bacterium]
MPPALLALLLLPASPASPALREVAVVANINDPVADGPAWEVPLRAALDGLPDVYVRTAADTRFGMYLAQQAGWHCEDIAPCLADLGRVLKVDTVLHASLDDRLASPRLTLVAIGVDARGETGRATAQLPGDPNAWRGPVVRLSRHVLRVGATVVVHGAGGGFTLDGEPFVAGSEPAQVMGIGVGQHVLTTPTGTRLGFDLPAGPLEVHLWPGADHAATAPAAPPAAAPPQTSRRGVVALAALAPAGALLLGGALVTLANAGAAAGAAAVVLGSLPRQSDGRVMARPGQSRREVELLVLTGLGLAGWALGSVCVSSLLASGALAWLGVGAAAWRWVD